MSVAGLGERIGRHYHGTDLALVDEAGRFRRAVRRRPVRAARVKPEA
jgi:hypothetical protein